MRPVRLEVRGFTAFRDAQVIDFEGLDLFAIWGPTGSGKSSLLDAMTYALYGQIERIGNRAGLLVSQGQARLSVLFEIEIGGTYYRIHRSTTRERPVTRVLLEKRSGGEWRSFGEGADRVREANRLIEGLLGLDYDAFTRSVILPQGKFAEFLVGDPPDRRAILTELLGLELFGRMSGRAQEIARAAQQAVTAKSDLLASEYAEVDEHSLQEARESELAALSEKEELQATVGALTELDRRFEETSRGLSAFTECREELDALQARVDQHANSLARLAAASGEAEQRLARARAKAAAAQDKADAAERAFDAAQGRWGKLEELSAASALADRSAEERAELAAAEEQKRAALHTLGEARSAVEQATTVLTAREEQAAEAARSLAAAERRHEEAHRSDLVGALTTGLGPGDPCPVCERPLSSAPAAVDEEALAAAAEELAAAKAAMVEAQELRAAAQREQALTDQKMRQAEIDLTRCAGDNERRAATLAGLHEQLARHFDGSLPDDPQAAIAERMSELRALAADLERAREEVDLGGAALAEEEKAVGALAGEIVAVRSALGAIDLRGAATRAERAAGALEAVLYAPSDLPGDPAQLTAATRRLAATIGALVDELQAARDKRLEERDSLLAEARRAAPEGLVVEPATTRSLIAAVQAALQEAVGTAHACAARASALEGRLARKRILEEEISTDARRAHVHKDLAYELRADRLVDFLQAEALETLAAFGSDRLAYLSGGRYRLAFDKEEFFVVDSWNGEDRRSVRTLSGGETFLASLALALALSEQVQALSVTQRAKLDSLFLDEGFGTLDAETLEIVVSAIEQLGGDGRMVGVITHVPELAERMPARLVLTKSPRGSTLARTP